MSYSPPEDFTGIVAAPQAEAAYEAAQVLAAGGNAADAVVSASLVQGVVDPHRCGLGGFGCATVCWSNPSQDLAFGFHGRVGERAHAKMWAKEFEGAAPDGFGYLVRGKVNDLGYQSITIPGMVAGLGAIHERFGSLPWRELVERAAEHAESGYLVPPQLAEFWLRPGLFGRASTLDRLQLTPTGREVALHADGKTYAGGELYRQPMLAQTYRRLAAEGPESFYKGTLADEIGADWEKNGALVTRQDLARYNVEISAPLIGKYRDHEVLTSPLPAGGVALLQTLALLEPEDLVACGHNTVEYIEKLGRAFQVTWRDRLANHSDPTFGGLTAEQLLAPKYIHSLRPGPAPGANEESRDTTQLTIVDRVGNVISFSHSLGYGSGVFTPGLGFMYNNCMSAFDPNPGQRNSITPGKARTTAVAETVLRRKGKPWLVLGSPGAARITAGLVQVIVNCIEFGMNVAESVVMPRFDAYAENQLMLESRFPLPVVDRLRENGWNVSQSPKPFGVVGRVYAAARNPDGKGWSAGVDPGEPGAAFRPRG